MAKRLFVVFSAQVSYSATALDRSDYLEEIHIDALAEAPYRAMLEALTSIKRAGADFVDRHGARRLKTRTRSG